VHLIDHFDCLDSEQLSRLFERPPQAIPVSAGARDLGYALGAVLYMPADRPTLVSDIVRRRKQGVQAVVIDLEDSIQHASQAEALLDTCTVLCALANERTPLPIIFVRVPDPETTIVIAEHLVGRPHVLDGFAFPKFDERGRGEAYFDSFRAAENVLGVKLLAMPIIEASVIAHRESRLENLLNARALLDTHRDSVACVRIGATDLSGAFGLRRDAESTIYDVRVVADAIGDIVNIFAREDPWSYPVSGPVWEHFAQSSRLKKPRLRESPFTTRGVSAYRRALLETGLDGLIAEVGLDKTNGLSGKTVIHPSHVSVVHALNSVTHEEYSDAVAIISARSAGGVVRSEYGNKMNEIKPHSAWARRTIVRAQAFGVLRPDKTVVDLLLTVNRETA
jgi:citrate lyase beta subunit